MSIKEQLRQDIDLLEEAELRQVADYLAFLKFWGRLPRPSLNASDLASFYAEFAKEDRAMAEEGMAEYREGLAREDAERFPEWADSQRQRGYR